MTTRVSQFMGGLGIDARNKLTVHDNSTVVLGTTGASGTSNLFVGKAVVAGVFSLGDDIGSESISLLIELVLLKIVIFLVYYNDDSDKFA